MRRSLRARTTGFNARADKGTITFVGSGYMGEATYYKIQTFVDRHGNVAWAVDPVIMLALHSLRSEWGHPLVLTANAAQRGVAELWLQARRSGFYTVALMCWYKCRPRTLHWRRIMEAEWPNIIPLPMSEPWNPGA